MRDSSVKVTLFRDLVQEKWPSIEVYAEHLISGLRRLDAQGWTFTTRCPGGVETARLAVPALYLSRTIIYPPFAWRHQGCINHVLDNSYGHLLHFIDAKRTVVTSHGGTPISWRKWNREGPAMRFFDWAFAGTLKAARLIIVSEYSKRELLEHYDYAPEKIHVVHHGVDENYEVLPRLVIDKVRQQYLKNGEQSIILHVGHCIARKNVETLLRAFARLTDESAHPCRLLQVGGKFSSEQRCLIERLGIGDRVTQLPQIPNDQLVKLYNAADVFAFPSLYEGFGVPLIEAMACGTPVACSEYDLFHEVCADAALFVSPLDDSGFAETISRLLENPEKAATLRARGVERAKEFSWEKCAHETLRVYEQISGSLG